MLNLFKNKEENNSINNSIEDMDIKPKLIEEDGIISTRDEIIENFIIRNPDLINDVQIGKKNNKDLKNEFYNLIDNYNMSKQNKEKVYKSFEEYILGWGVLTPLIEDKYISDIKVISYDNIRIKVKGKRKSSNIKFKDEEDLKKFINIIAIRNGGTLAESNSIQVLTDKESNEKFIFRIDISSEYINSVKYPYIAIRKTPKEKYSMNQLENLKMFNNEIKQYLIKRIKAGATIFVVGKGASGKTTLLNALLEEIPHDKSALVIQESEELFSKKHPDMMFQRVRRNKSKSKISYELRDLAINGLLLDLDYFCIGEIKGDEAFDMFNAVYTGHTGLSSGHGNSYKEGINKLVQYMKYSQYSKDFKREDLIEMLNAIDIVVFMKDFKVFHIGEIEEYNYAKKNLDFRDIFKYEINKGKGEFVKVNESCPKVEEKLKYYELDI